MAKIVQKYGKTPIGWDPIDTSSDTDSSVVLQNWKDSNASAREKNMKMIISIAGKTYLDMKYNESTTYGLDWTPKEERNWVEYKIRLEKQKERLKNQGINFYIYYSPQNFENTYIKKLKILVLCEYTFFNMSIIIAR